MEQIEAHDWGVGPHTDNEERRQRSIQAYWLPEWYDKVSDLTFATQFFTELPDRFPPSMVRWENKSPKDSDQWGPVETKEAALNLFYTSLRCKTNPGKIYCLREWKQLKQEWRCFWNGRITAISGDVPATKELIEYLIEISDRIPYYRCVMDVALAEKYYIVEFNSWETNSGAHLFDWTEDLLYDSQVIICRWPGGQSEFDWPKPSTLPKLESNIPLDQVIPIQPSGPAGWVIKEDLYVCDDVWLARVQGKIKAWRRGPFRFDHLQETVDGLKAGSKAFYTDLTPQTKPIVVRREGTCPTFPYRYGFVGLYQGNPVFVRFYGGQFYPVLK